MGARLRVVSFNIQHGLRSDGARVDVPLAGSVAAGLKPDILALQEVDVGAPRSGFVDEGAEIAAACGLDHAFVPAAVIGGVGRYGNVLAARGALRDVEVKRLPRRRFRSEPRAVGIGRAALGGGVEATVAVTHLSIHREEVFDQLRSSINWLVSRPAPWIYIGDLNLLPHEIDDTLRDAGLELADTAEPTFPASSPRIRIDHVAVGGGLRVESVRVAATNASDHRPLVVEVLTED